MDSDGQDPARHYLNIAQSLFNFSGLCLATLDPSYRLLEANVEFFQRFGGSAYERRGESFYDFVHLASREGVRRKFARLARAGCSHVTQQFVGIGPDRCLFIGTLRGIAVRDASGLMDAVVVMIRPDEVASAATAGALKEIDARILEGVAAGASTIQLATRLHMSRQGIEYRVACMLRKYKVPNRPALVSRAYATGVLSAGSWPPQVLTDCDH